MQLRKTIQILAESNKFDEALNLLSMYASQYKNQDLQDATSLLKGRFKELNTDRIHGLLTHEEKIILTNAIRLSIIELKNTIDEPKVIEQSIQREMESINLNIYEKSDSDRFFKWVQLNLMDINILIPCLLMLCSLYFLFSWKVTGNYTSYKNYGIVANFVLAVSYLLRPLIKQSKYSMNNISQTIAEEDKKEKLKYILDIETDYGLNNAYQRALSELNRFGKYWLWVWIGWVILYLYWIIGDICFPELVENFFYRAIQPVVNNVSSLFILFAFLILYFKRDDKINNNGWQFIFSSLFILSILIVIQNLDHAPNQSRQIDAISGLFAGLAIALLSGRLDSKFLAIPFWVIVFLYTYALIQSSIKDFQDKDELKALLVNTALFAKSLLMILFAWLTATNRLLYYLIVANKKEGDMKTNVDNIFKYL